jgi:DNA polymerase-4
MSPAFLSSAPPDPLFAAIRVPGFIAQAVAAARPDLRGRAFVVAEQDAQSSKTLVREASESARAEGITPGLPVFWVQRKWPRVLILPRDAAAEHELRSRLQILWDRLTPVFESDDHGAALLDLTGTPWSRKVLHDEAGLALLGKRLEQAACARGPESVSVGIAPSQVVAKVLARTGGVGVCVIGEETPLPPGFLPDLSPKARERLRKYGLERVAMVRALGKEELTLRFGPEGERLYTLARGLDLKPVAGRREPVGVETMLPRDLNDQEALRNQVRLTADKLAHALRREETRAARFSMVLTYSDRRETRRTVRLQPPTAAFPPLADKAVEAFFDMYQRRVALRRIRMVVTAPAHETRQGDLFEDHGKSARTALESAIDKIRRKRGFADVLSGSNVEKREGKKSAKTAAKKGPQPKPQSQPALQHPAGRDQER